MKHKPPFNFWESESDHIFQQHKYVQSWVEVEVISIEGKMCVKVKVTEFWCKTYDNMCRRQSWAEVEVISILEEVNKVVAPDLLCTRVSSATRTNRLGSGRLVSKKSTFCIFNNFSKVWKRTWTLGVLEREKKKATCTPHTTGPYIMSSTSNWEVDRLDGLQEAKIITRRRNREWRETITVW